jgi:hypothetical protein
VRAVTRSVLSVHALLASVASATKSKSSASASLFESGRLEQHPRQRFKHRRG